MTAIETGQTSWKMSLNNSSLASAANGLNNTGTGANYLQIATSYHVAPSTLSLPPNSPTSSIGSSSSIDLLASSDGEDLLSRECFDKSWQPVHYTRPSSEAMVPPESSRTRNHSHSVPAQRDSRWDFLPRRRKFEEIDSASSSSSIDLEPDNSEDDGEHSEFSHSNLYGQHHYERQSSLQSINSSTSNPDLKHQYFQPHGISKPTQSETESQSNNAGTCQPDTLYDIHEHTRIVIDRFPVAFHLPDIYQSTLNETQRKQLPIAPTTVLENPVKHVKESTTEALIGVPQNIIFENGLLNAKLVKLMSDSKLKLDQFDHLCKKMRTTTGWAPPVVEGSPSARDTYTHTAVPGNGSAGTKD
ncbi:hypothetical protein HDU81_003130 [Chytriomyces hyalinus]|nr:hypothetical protein HDU81_003130 [Chytriomyces hyalinus]